MSAGDVHGLLPCPFCGGDGHIDGTSWTTRDGQDQAWVTCKKCNTYGPSSTNAVAAWNRRSALDGDVLAKLIAEAEARWMERAANMVALTKLAYLPHSPGAVAFFADPTMTLNNAAEAIRAEAAAIRSEATK